MTLQGIVVKRLCRWIGGIGVLLGLFAMSALATPARGQQHGAKDAKAAKDAVRTAEIQVARAQVKLLEAQMDAKKAELRDMEAAIKKAHEQLAKLEGTDGLTFTFVLGEKGTGTLMLENGKRKGQPRFQGTAVLKLQDVKRPIPQREVGVIENRSEGAVLRLLQNQGKPSVIPSSGLVIKLEEARSPAQRLADLEKQMNSLLKEMAELRRELQSQGQRK